MPATRLNGWRLAFRGQGARLALVIRPHNRAMVNGVGLAWACVSTPGAYVPALLIRLGHLACGAKREGALASNRAELGGFANAVRAGGWNEGDLKLG